MPTYQPAPSQVQMPVMKVTVPSYLKIGKIVGYLVRIWSIIGIFALSMRVFLLLTSANPATPFVRFIYNTSEDYLRPFQGIFPVKPVGDTGYFDVAATFAIIVYLFLMWAASELIDYMDYRIAVFKQKKAAELQAMTNQSRATLQAQPVSASTSTKQAKR